MMQMTPKLIAPAAASLAGSRRPGTVTRASTEPVSRATGVSGFARSACIDSKLRDAVGKLAGLPLHVLWGSA